jgi:crossover junction endonuclease MUS81
MKLILDCRETNLLKSCEMLIKTTDKFKNIKISTENLLIGDISINHEDNNVIILFERKSISDLISSIKDGRYKEQSYRLSGSEHPNHNIVYIIEGPIGKFIDKQIVYSSMFSLNYYKGFSVFRSFSLDKTANIICNMAYKMGKDLNKKPYYLNKLQVEVPINESGDIAQVTTSDESELTEKDYVGVVKKVKKDNITPDNIGEIMLCQIPGISSVTALAIMEKYQNIPNLIKELELNNDSMKDLSYTNVKGQVRKINKTSIANIVKFLLKK